MRYFIAKNGATVVDKQAFSDGQNVDVLISQYKINHPALTVTEVDQPTFDGSAMTTIQQSWQTAKAGGPASALTFIAHFLGLE